MTSSRILMPSHASAPSSPGQDIKWVLSNHGWKMLLSKSNDVDFVKLKQNKLQISSICRLVEDRTESPNYAFTSSKEFCWLDVLSGNRCFDANKLDFILNCPGCRIWTIAMYATWTEDYLTHNQSANQPPNQVRIQQLRRSISEVLTTIQVLTHEVAKIHSAISDCRPVRFRWCETYINITSEGIWELTWSKNYAILFLF